MACTSPELSNYHPIRSYGPGLSAVIKGRLISEAELLIGEAIYTDVVAERGKEHKPCIVTSSAPTTREVNH